RELARRGPPLRHLLPSRRGRLARRGRLLAAKGDEPRRPCSQRQGRFVMRLGKHKVEIALLILVPILAIWLFLDRGSLTTREAEMRKRNLLQAFRRDQIERIAFERDGAGFGIVKRGEGGDSMY